MPYFTIANFDALAATMSRIARRFFGSRTATNAEAACADELFSAA